jgi:hypothetical protein
MDISEIVDNYVRKRCKTEGVVIWKPVVVIRTLDS